MLIRIQIFVKITYLSDVTATKSMLNHEKLVACFDSSLNPLPHLRVACPTWIKISSCLTLSTSLESSASLSKPRLKTL